MNPENQKRLESIRDNMIRWNSGEHSTNPDWPTCFEWKGGQNFIDEIGWLLALVDEQQKTITELREILNED